MESSRIWFSLVTLLTIHFLFNQFYATGLFHNSCLFCFLSRPSSATIFKKFKLNNPSRSAILLPTLKARYLV